MELVPLDSILFTSLFSSLAFAKLLKYSSFIKTSERRTQSVVTRNKTRKKNN